MSLRFHGGWVVTAGFSEVSPDLYEGFDRFSWPIPMSRAEEEMLGIGGGICKLKWLEGSHELATVLDGVELYLELCQIEYPSARLYWAQTESFGVEWAHPTYALEWLGYDLINPFNLTSVYTEIAHVSPDWEHRLNAHKLFDSIEDTGQFMMMRQEALRAGAPIEDWTFLVPLGVFRCGARTT
jgi:hypothetical protein